MTCKIKIVNAVLFKGNTTHLSKSRTLQQIVLATTVYPNICTTRDAATTASAVPRIPHQTVKGYIKIAIKISLNILKYVDICGFPYACHKEPVRDPIDLIAP